MESAPSSASFKRARPPGFGNQVPSCLVDGCTADLSKCRDYHRRHKVCEVHSKTPKVSIRGQEQRFCQQCSRFHSLVEFDEGKRSCRKRLDGHNRRRRKPQPNALTVNSGSLLSNPPGSRYLLFSGPQIFSTTSMTDSSTGAVKVKTDISSALNFSSRNSSFVGASSLNYKGERQFSFLQSANSSHPGVSVCQPLVNANPSPGNGGITQKMLLNGLNRTVESNRALSLLSSQPAETREISLSPMVQSGSTSSLIPNLQYKGLGMEGEQVGTILATDQNTNTDLHGNGVFRTGHPGSSASGTHHTLTFSWE
ncbi:squamosa promoter-binding-like protein 16 [Gossypium arboreum]|uniref:squamosa promoter-binding-like protein 16 n=1 Tax=Gossypium arboreum TaxID=29729 RepID=UPI0008193424|nr:squamosa promoter-binding-like protein 16 [Gossypium arboreum]XP_052881563.1 squamosa promoter-binding-like protein 16 [Gossypium arboreum]